MGFPGFVDLFHAMRREVDDVLAEVPPSLLEARRLIARELLFEPRPEELQTIVKIAGFMSTSVVFYELPRQMLALRVLAERVLLNHWTSPRLVVERLAQTAAIIEDLLAAFEQSQSDLAADADTMVQLADEEREFLLHVKDVMLVPKNALEATTILAPRLELLAQEIDAGYVAETFPGLDDAEIEMFDLAVRLEGGAQQGPNRICLDAVALRTLYEECHAVWERVGTTEDAELIEQLSQSIRERLRDAETAYRVVSARLQAQQDEAISASLDEFAADIRAAKSKLFEAYLKTQPLMKEPRIAKVGDGPQRSLEETLAEAEDADERTLSRKMHSEELFLNALTGLRQDRAAGRDMSMHPLARAKRAYKRRLWMLGATIAVLVLAAVSVQGLLLDTIPEPIPVSLKEFQPSHSVIDAKPIGPMLYVRVSDWDNLTVASTRFRTAEIGELASSKGFLLVYVVSERGRELAQWHHNGGVLVKPKQLEPQDVITQSEAARDAEAAARREARKNAR